MRFLPTDPRRWLLPYALCAVAGCAHESGAVKLRDALDAESNRLTLLREDSGTVKMAPSLEPYWVAVVPDDEGANLGRELPLTRGEYARTCPSESGARILVGDRSGIDCVISTALHIDAVHVVSKTQADGALQIELVRGIEGVRIIALY
jgi:hypothetical protein